MNKKTKVFFKTMSVYAPDTLFKDVFIKHLDDLGYKISYPDVGTSYSWDYIWINESHRGDKYGKGKVRFALLSLNEPNCLHFKIPQQYKDALYEASKILLSKDKTVTERMYHRNPKVCKECGCAMKKSKAMEQTFTGIPDFIGGEVCTVSAGGPGKLVDCLKCEGCGWSVTVTKKEIELCH